MKYVIPSYLFNLKLMKNTDGGIQSTYWIIYLQDPIQCKANLPSSIRAQSHAQRPPSCPDFRGKSPLRSKSQTARLVPILLD